MQYFLFLLIKGLFALKIIHTMEWRKYWDASAQSEDRLSQVGRLNADPGTTVKQAADRIIALLDIRPGDAVLDVCCGNGLITDYLAKPGVEITGVDLSEKLIAIAKMNNSNIRFMTQNALQLHIDDTFDKIYIAFSFQYFDKLNEGEKVIENLIKHAKPNALILLTDIPDKARWGTYYNTLLKKFFYFKQKISGRQAMGKFWSERELEKFCSSLSVHGEVIKQPGNLPYSYYRFDYLIKCGS